MRKKIINMACCLMLGIINTTAQNEKHSYVSVHINTGLTSLGFKVKELNGSAGNSSSKIGVGFNANYNYYFNKHWGVGAGLGLSAYKTRASLKGGMNESSIYALGSYIDDDGSGLPRNFDLRGRIENIEEKQNIQLFEIPVAALYQTRFSYGKWGAYGSFGLKFRIPVSKKFEVPSKTSGRLNVSGFYTDNTQEFDMGAPDNPPVTQHGFGTLANPGATCKWEGSSSLKTGLAITFDVGAIHRLTNESDLCFGLYADCGINDIKNSKIALLTGPTGSYHPDANHHIGKGITYNGLLNSNHTNKVIPLSFGIKIGVRFNL